MTLWDKFGRTGKRVTIILTLLSAISIIGGKYILPAIKSAQKYAYIPELVRLNDLKINARIDSLAREQLISERIDSSLHSDLMLTEHGLEGIWSLVMARTEPHDEKDYEMVLDGNDIGSAVDVFLRDDDSRPPQVWAFWKVCGLSGEMEGHCHYYVLQANWSNGYSRYYITDFDGEERIIYKKN